MDKIPTGDARPPSGAIARGAVRECYNRAAPHQSSLAHKLTWGQIGSTLPPIADIHR